MSSQLYTNTNGRLAVVMVGLPATGKTFTARNLSRYLRWLGVRTRTFSVAAYRRAHLATTNGVGVPAGTADFFDPQNNECLRVRTDIAEQALNDLLAWLDWGGQVGILDGSNTIKARRDAIEQRLSQHKVQCIFLECLYDESATQSVEGHVEELLLTCPEYAGWNTRDALQDYIRRISHYRLHYQTLTAFPPLSGFLQCVNGGEQLIVERVNGFLCSRITYYLMNLRSVKRSIYLMPITEGVTTASDIHAVCRMIVMEDCKTDTKTETKTEVQVWTPTAPAYTCFRMMPRLRALEVGLAPTPTTPNSQSPPITDAYFARNPQGESYHDLAIRLEPVIMDMEGGATTITLIAADATVLRCLYGYFCEASRTAVVGMEVRGEEVVVLRPRAFGCFERRVAVDGWRQCGEETLRLYNDNIVSPK